MFPRRRRVNELEEDLPFAGQVIPKGVHFLERLREVDVRGGRDGRLIRSLRKVDLERDASLLLMLDISVNPCKTLVDLLSRLLLFVMRPRIRAEQDS